MTPFIATAFVFSCLVYTALSYPRGGNGKKPSQLESSEEMSSEEYSSADGIELAVMGCFTDRQHEIVFECHAPVMDWLDENYIQNCSLSDASPNKELTVEEQLCFDIQMNHLRNVYAECLFTKLGSLKTGGGKIDIELSKTMIISAANLSSTQKEAALSTFDACMVADLPSPYSPIHFNRNAMPPVLNKLTAMFESETSMGRQVPTLPIITFDCFNVALIQNGCVTLTEAEVTELLALYNSDQY